MKHSILICIFIAFAGASIAFSGASIAFAADPTQIVTYNIRYLNNNDGEDHWKNRVDAVSEVVATADIVGLQEATRPQIDQIAERASDYHWYGEGRDDGKDRGEFTPIFWKKGKFELLDKGTFWLGPDPTAVGKPAWGAGLPRICSWVALKSAESEDPLLVFNTHFDHQSGEARLNSADLIRQQAAEIAGRFKDLHAVVLMGDFNCEINSEPMKQLISVTGSGMTFVDSHNLSKKKPSGPTGTWNGFDKIVEGRRIDFVFIGQPKAETAATSTVVVHQTLDPKTAGGRFASDHLPVAIELK